MRHRIVTSVFKFGRFIGPEYESAGARRNTYHHRSSCYDNKVELGGEEIRNVTTFKYIGSIFDAEGGTTTDCTNRVRLAWNKWREVTGEICDPSSSNIKSIRLLQNLL